MGQEIAGSAELPLDMGMSTFKDTKVRGLKEAGTVQFPGGVLQHAAIRVANNDTVFNDHNPSQRTQISTVGCDDRLATLDRVRA